MVNKEVFVCFHYMDENFCQRKINTRIKFDGSKILKEDMMSSQKAGIQILYIS